MLHPYLHHRVAYGHDVYLINGEGKSGLALLGPLSCYQNSVCGVYADVIALGGACDAQRAAMALYLDTACLGIADGGIDFLVGNYDIRASVDGRCGEGIVFIKLSSDVSAVEGH